MAEAESMFVERFVFDLQGNPPDKAELQATFSQVEKAEKSYARWMPVMLVLLVTLQTAAALSMSILLLLSATLVSTLVLYALFVRHGTPWFDFKILRRVIEPVTPESDPEAHLQLAAIIEEAPALHSYFQAVAAQGRLPVRGEINAAMAWVADAEHRQLQAKAQAAWQSRYEQ